MIKRGPSDVWFAPGGVKGEALEYWFAAQSACGEKTRGRFWEALIHARISVVIAYQQAMTDEVCIDRAERTIAHLRTLI